MPMITDWIMVGITAVYVVATIAICCANIKSANATREQLIESKKQFEEHRRLEVLPYLQIEFLPPPTEMQISDIHLNLTHTEYSYASIIDRTIYIKNIGMGTAVDITYIWKGIDQAVERRAFTETVLRSGEVCEALTDFCIEHDESCEEQLVSASIEFEYKDLLDNKYSRNLDLWFHIGGNDSIRFDSFKGNPPIQVDEP